MSDYYGTARSNYFGVKDRRKFVEWCDSLELKPIHKTEKAYELCGFLVETEFGNIPDHITKDDEVYDIDFFGELSTHLIDGDVAIVMEIGREKMRYLNGLAIAVNSKGETVSIALNDIYEKAKDLGNSTEVEY